MNKFIQNTISPEDYEIIDVPGDNACLYHAMTLGLTQHFEVDNLEELAQKSFKPEVFEIYNDLWEFEPENIRIARALQQVAKDTIVEFYDRPVSELSSSLDLADITCEDLVEMTHNISIEDYEIMYSFYAADDLTDIILDLDDFEFEDLMFLLHNMTNRWGGLTEQLAISYLFKVPIKVYALQRYNKKKRKIITGRLTKKGKAEKGVRFAEYQYIGSEYDTEPIYLLWKKYRDQANHYMFLKKN